MMKHVFHLLKLQIKMNVCSLHFLSGTKEAEVRKQKH